MALSTRQKKVIKVTPKRGKMADVVAPSDSKDLVVKGGRLFIGTRGHVKVLTEDGNTITLKNISDGTFLDFVKVKKVFSTGTTARDIVVIY